MHEIFAWARRPKTTLLKEVAKACGEAHFCDTTTWKQASPVSTLAEPLQCPHCPFQGLSAVALGTHCRRVHGIKRFLTDRIDTSHCEACLTQHHTVEQLIRHVTKDSKRCRNFYARFISTKSDEALQAIAKRRVTETHAQLAAGFRPDKARRKAFRLCGPLTREARLVGISHTLHSRCGPLDEAAPASQASEPARSASSPAPSRSCPARVVPPPMPAIPEESRRRRRARRKMPEQPVCVFAAACEQSPGACIDAHLSHDQLRDRG